ncbi:hypothetical protein Pan241w_54390 [Gimesia alba]|uniref:Uncharacterized protein n=1 Tax=Gimesia alba TaxID=2527973 RepID=A0A517RN71_9PLAN|nr:hypothetical protein [Gimesia alba]QDT45319.1 hypothetical protein Pan241w_54390 [Gimesia alba]
MSNDNEEKPAKAYQVLLKEQKLGLFIGLLFGFLISPIIRNAFLDSAGYWLSLFIAIALSASGAAIVAYSAVTLLSRKSQS